ncbi:MAG: 4Fe-4S dicluster domain-containing protein [Eggerthellaceae bacterium]|nr:4Fe-4S dicluster domain-containing protein [Eggerthellaceae bacterium]MCH4221737.1 4Fe-4S dicluster domain-containing protein [Eggerthellaceae bacterium]
MGNTFVIADPRKCVGCKACMSACLVKHFVPGDVPVARLNVVQIGQYTAPILCHHCSNAPCAAACPTHALYNEGDRVAVRLDRCIGCRSCVVACPFGAVDVVDRYDTAHVGDLKIGTAPCAMVIKCDRCVDRPEGPACIQACTSHALRLVNQDEIDAQRGRRSNDAAHELV